MELISISKQDEAHHSVPHLLLALSIVVSLGPRHSHENGVDHGLRIVQVRVVREETRIVIQLISEVVQHARFKLVSPARVLLNLLLRRINSRLIEGHGEFGPAHFFELASYLTWTVVLSFFFFVVSDDFERLV